MCPEGEGVAAVVRRIGGFGRTVVVHRDLLVAGLAREVAARTRGSALGVAWLVAGPLALFVVYAFLFTRVLGMRLGEGPSAALGVYMFIGTLAFSDVAHQNAVRLGVLTGSLASGLLGAAVLMFAAKRRETVPQGAPA